MRGFRRRPEAALTSAAARRFQQEACKELMDSSADDICRRMEAVRHTAGEEVETIVQSARTLSDWRYYVKNHPVLLASAAAGLGFLLVPRKKSRQGPAADDAKELIELLKKHHVRGVTVEGPPSSLLKTVVGIATPFLIRTALNFAQTRLATGGDWHSLFSAGKTTPATDGEEGAQQSFEEFNIPR